MSLFGKKDAGVPLLTAFYQLEVDRANLIGGELDIFFARLLSGDPMTKTPESDKYKEKEASSGFLLKVADLHSDVVRLMDCSADGLPFEQADVDTLNKFVKIKGGMPSFVLDKDKTGAVLFRPYGRIASTYKELEIMPRICEEFINAFIGKGFARCPICNAVFVKGRLHQIRCSRRCNDRSSGRRRYKPKSAPSRSE